MSRVIEGWTEGMLRDAARVVLNTRDLCGNEARALEEYCREFEVSNTEESYMAVYRYVEAEWSRSRRAARIA